VTGTNSIGDRLREVRKRRGLTQRELAQLSVTCLLPALAAAAALTLGSPTAQAAGTLTSTRPPQPPPGGILSSVSCSSASFCVAVGNPGNISSLAVAWNGSTWQKQSLPNGGKNLVPLAVSCVSPDFCEAVGAKLTSSSQVALILTWNGTHWAVQTSPHYNGGELIGVSCSSTTACLAVGQVEELPSGVLRPLAERWSEQHWSPVHVPEPSGVSGNLDAVSCSSATACTAGGGYFDMNTQTYTPLLERWNGSKLVRQQSAQPTSPDPSSISGVSCPIASGCIAVGDILNEPIVQSWNGTTWVEMTIPSTVGQLRGVSCTAITACTDVGYMRSGLIAERLRGTAWTAESTPQPPGSQGASFQAVSCVLASDCVAAGEYGTGSEENLSLAEQWNGTQWTVQPTPDVLAG
jgi:hypothetical protein